MIISKNDFNLELSEPVNLLRFAGHTPEYYGYEGKSGLYAIFRRNGAGGLELEYIGIAPNGKYGLAGRLWQHAEGNPLIRRYVKAGDYAVGLLVVEDKAEIARLEAEAIKVFNPPGNRTLLEGWEGA
jgi:hypothetical protein